MTARAAAGVPALLLLILAVACCPVPVAGGSETAFSATVGAALGASAGRGPVGELVEARLSSGSSVRLVIPVGTETPEAGALIWVEGTTSGDLVQVRSLRVIEQVASDSE